jgi:hypothetical protein
MTTSIEIQKQKKREKRAEEIRDKFDVALLSELGSDDPAAVRAALKIVNDRAFERIDALQAEIDGLKTAAGDAVPRADFDAAVAAKTAAEAETQTLKDSLDAALEDERRTLKHSLADIEQREHNLKIKIEAATKKFEATGIKTVIEILQKMVQTGDLTVPDFFKCPCKHVILWKTFWDDTMAEAWCRLAQDNSFTTDTAIEILHVPACPYDGWEEPVRRKTQLERCTPESRAYAMEFLKHKGWADQKISDAVGQLVRQHAERDANRPIRNVYELEEQSRWLHPTPVQRVHRDMIDENVQRPPEFVPDPYPYCGDN